MKAIGRDSERETMGSSPTKLVRCTKTGRWERKPALSEDDHEKHEQAVEDDIDTVATFTPSFCPRFIDKSFVWKGVRKNRHRVDVLDFNHIEQLTDEEQVEAAGSELLKFWDLTPELCQAIGVSMETIDDILVVQGVRSLGQMVHKEVDKVVATLLSIVVFTLKQYIKKHRKVFNLDNNLDINILTINSKASTIAVNGIEIEYKEPYSSGLLWLKSKERELPPLYNILELGNSKMDFLCQLVKIFVQ